MPSFRSKVLDALDIQKKSIRLPVFETFPNPDPANAQTFGESAKTTSGMQSYAISECIRKKIIGPQNKQDRIEVLGFVVGADPKPSSTNPSITALPDCVNRASGETYTGFHHLGGLYDDTNVHLQSMRKSAPEPLDLQTTYAPGNHGVSSASSVAIHTHKDWPNQADEQAMLLQDDPYSDSLYYHETSLRFFLTGLDDVAAASDGGKSMGDASANHRGSVRMLVLRPKTPKVSMRLEGSGTGFTLNHDFTPDWETELFYDRARQVGGRLTSRLPHTTGSLATNPLPHPDPTSYDSDAIVTYGLQKYSKIDKSVDTNLSSTTYGHLKPASGGDHELNPFDILTSKINTKKYAVLEDRVFTLDSLHHGAAAHHVANVRIPYYKKVRFGGRKPDTGDDGEILGLTTFNEPLNLPSRPIVLFLSYNQRISAQVNGYTAISEV